MGAYLLVLCVVREEGCGALGGDKALVRGSYGVALMR